MDLLFTRYASPFLLLDELIPNARFSKFIDTIYEVKEEEQLWDFYINKLSVWDERTFDEFKNSVKKKNIEKPSNKQLEATVSKSWDILNDFKIGGVD